MNLNEKFKNVLKLQGFIVEPKAIIHLSEKFKDVKYEDINKIIDKLIISFNEMNLKNNKITLEIIDEAIRIFKKEETNVDLFQVIDAFQIPLLQFQSGENKFTRLKDIKTPFFWRLISDNACNKTEILRHRYEIIFQRLRRNSIFTIKDSMKTVEFLLSCGVTLKTVVVFGMLTQHQDDQWCLEDSTGTVIINLSKVQYHKGLIVEGSFVLAEGKYDDGTLYASTIGMPPLESGSVSRLAIQKSTNYFGGFPPNDSVKTCGQITRAANSSTSMKTIIFASELWLDKESILQKIKTLFHGYAGFQPVAFVFCGNFLSPDTDSLNATEKLRILKNSIKIVIQSYARFPSLALSSHLIFVPGPNDPFHGLRNVLPRPSLPRSFFIDDIRSLPNISPVELDEIKERVIFASSPCRMTFYNKEIVVFRDSISQKLIQHCMHIPSKEDPIIETDTLEDSMVSSFDNTTIENSDLNTSVRYNTQRTLDSHLVWTILTQAHLMPLPIHVSPVYWGFDHALHLFPLPDLLVLSDPLSTSFDLKINECHVMNPSNFSAGENFSFRMYFPYKGEVQSCTLDI